MQTFTDIAEIRNAIGSPLEPGPWVEIDQRRVDAFAEATEDRQWIHVDPERARSGPFGGTIAHGFLTLSLVAGLSSEVIEFSTSGPVINYGLNKVRFPAPVLVGSRVRLGSAIVSVDDAPHGTLVTVKHTMELAGSERPACIAEALTMLFH